MKPWPGNLIKHVDAVNWLDECQIRKLSQSAGPHIASINFPECTSLLSRYQLESGTVFRLLRHIWYRKNGNLGPRGLIARVHIGLKLL